MNFLTVMNSFYKNSNNNNNNNGKEIANGKNRMITNSQNNTIDERNETTKILR